MKFLQILRSINGISCPIAGVQWTPPKSEQATAKALMVALEDRRVLYAPFQMEGHQYCRISVEQIRGFLTDALKDVDNKSPLYTTLQKGRRAARRFCNIVGSPAFDTQLYSIQKSILIRELTRLRFEFGVVVASLALSYELDVHDELASAIPFTFPIK